MTEAAEASIVVPPAPTQVFIPPSNLPPPKALNFDDNLATAWKSWKAAWQRYEIATGVYKQEGIVRVSTLLSIIGEDGVRAHDTFIWNEDENADDISQVLKKFDEFCIPRTQVIYERYRFNNRNQEPGENISTYLTELRTIAKNCAHDTITPDEILRDRLVLGIRDDRVRERLLRLNDLSLLQAVDIIKSSEQTQQQVKLMAGGDTAVHALRKAGSAEKPEEERQLKSQAFRRPSKECGNCGMVHGRHCPAYGRTCFNCGSMNHFANKCRANPRGVKSRVSAVHEAVDMGNDPYYIGATTSKSKGQEKLAVVKLHIYGPDPKTEVQFQIDTGSQCDILPAQLYKQITGDTLLHRLKPCQKEIVSYTGDRRKIAGKATLPVWSRGQRRSMEFNILDGDYQPILSLNTSLNLGFVSLHNCDVLALHVKCPKASLLEEYEDVFDGLGALPGTYKIAIDEQAQPVVHAPRRVPVALRPCIKNKLDELVDRKVIIPVTEPTQWVSSMLAIVKPNKVRICIDPRDLNRAIRREHYQLPTIDEVASRLTGAKKFTLCDAKDGFHQILLDDASSFLTTFNTPFGRYRWARMPFGISSAPEVWQRRMHEFVENLEGVEVIADDFLIAGFGETDAEVNSSLEKNERAFFKKCREWNLKLNKLKLKRSQTEVRFMGHLLTPDGLKADPAKVEAILDMPPPTDVKGLKRFLGMVNYLAKFLPLLSDMTEPLRRLEDKDVEWCWLAQHEKAFTTVKEYLAKAPVLKYYDVTEEVTIQCDASITGLGAVLMQKGQPVAFASRALTDTETRYAQIEKELLAIVWSTDKFNQYILGREVVHIESDHEPLRAVFTKPIHNSPKRLQRMLMALQNYSLDVQYKKGELMWVSDALSRAYRNTTEASKHDTSLICTLAEIDHSENLSIAPYRLAEFRNDIARDPVMQKLIGAIKGEWPVSRKSCIPELTPYYDKRSELIEDKGLVFLGERLLVPPSLRKEMLKQIHRSHIGIEGCLRRAREVLYWPLMNSEVKDFVSKCSICQSYQPDQCREELQPYPIPSRPWSMLGADFFDLGQQHFFVLVDYWSGFFEVQEVKVATSASVIAACKVQFARHGIPDVLITDNGPQFTSSVFSAFVREWQFEHRTSSPRYPQSNGRAENAVKTCKNLMTKAKADGQDPLLALLDWRNTPTEGLGTSPVQRLMGRRTRTFLPTHETLLRQPSHQETATKLAERKKRQAQQYNKKFRPLEALKCGQAIRMRLPGREEWSLGTCMKALGNRSYEVEVCGRRYRRNRRQLRLTPETAPPMSLVELTPPESTLKPAPNLTEPGPPPPEFHGETKTERMPPENEMGTELEPQRIETRRSERRRRPPLWHQDYHMN